MNFKTVRHEFSICVSRVSSGRAEILVSLLLLLLHLFNDLFSRTTWVSRYQKGKTCLDLNEARDDGVWGCSGISWTICKHLHLAADR